MPTAQYLPTTTLVTIKVSAAVAVVATAQNNPSVTYTVPASSYSTLTVMLFNNSSTTSYVISINGTSYQTSGAVTSNGKLIEFPALGPGTVLLLTTAGGSGAGNVAGIFGTTFINQS